MYTTVEAGEERTYKYTQKLYSNAQIHMTMYEKKSTTYTKKKKTNAYPHLFILL